MALANVAELLANDGHHVVVVDWDLEAPGLEKFLVDDPEESTQYAACPGVLDLLLEYRNTLAGLGASEEVESSDFANVGELRLRRPSSYCVPIPRPHAARLPGSLSLLSAGRRDGPSRVSYAQELQGFDWDDFYENWAGGAYIDFLRADLKKSGATVVLIDSRTGVTESGGICTHHLADFIVLLSGASVQSTEGTLRMVEALNAASLRKARAGRDLGFMVVRARIDQSGEAELLGEFIERFDRCFSPHLAPEIAECAAFHLTEIPYKPHYAFTERVIARRSSAAQRGARNLLEAYKNIAQAVLTWGGSRELAQRLSGKEQEPPSLARRAQQVSEQVPVEAYQPTGEPLEDIAGFWAVARRRARAFLDPEDFALLDGGVTTNIEGAKRERERMQNQLAEASERLANTRTKAAALAQQSRTRGNWFLAVGAIAAVIFATVSTSSYVREQEERREAERQLAESLKLREAQEEELQKRQKAAQEQLQVATKDIEEAQTKSVELANLLSRLGNEKEVNATRIASAERELAKTNVEKESALRAKAEAEKRQRAYADDLRNAQEDLAALRASQEANQQSLEKARTALDSERAQVSRLRAEKEKAEYERQDLETQLRTVRLKNEELLLENDRLRNTAEQQQAPQPQVLEAEHQ